MGVRSMNAIPDWFLADRYAALVVAADREFRHSREPIPELPECPGFYVPRPKNTAMVAPMPKREPLGHLECNRRWRASRRLRNRIGQLPPGTEIEMESGVAVIMAYIAPGDDPMAPLPKDTMHSHMSGCRERGPSHLARYAVKVWNGRHWHYYWPKAATVDRDYRG